MAASPIAKMPQPQRGRPDRWVVSMATACAVKSLKATQKLVQFGRGLSSVPMQRGCQVPSVGASQGRFTLPLRTCNLVTVRSFVRQIVSIPTNFWQRQKKFLSNPNCHLCILCFYGIKLLANFVSMVVKLPTNIFCLYGC